MKSAPSARWAKIAIRGLTNIVGTRSHFPVGTCKAARATAPRGADDLAKRAIGDTKAHAIHASEPSSWVGCLPRRQHLVGWLQETSKPSDSTFAMTGYHDQSASRNPDKGARTSSAERETQWPHSTVYGGGLLGVKPSPVLSCVGPWTPEADMQIHQA